MQSGSKAASSEVLAVLYCLMARRCNQWCSEVCITSAVEPASWWQLVLAEDAPGKLAASKALASHASSAKTGRCSPIDQRWTESALVSGPEVRRKQAARPTTVYAVEQQLAATAHNPLQQK